MRVAYYQISTGQILGVQVGTWVTLADFYLDTDRSVLEIDEDDINTHPDTHYVAEGALAERPEMGAEATVITDTIRVSDLVVGADVTLTGAIRSIMETATGTTVDFEGLPAGDYVALVHLWPYREQELAATVSA